MRLRLSLIFLIVTIFSGVMALPVSAQDGDTVHITAEVIYPTAPIYVFPSVRARTLATLNEGDELTVLYREDSREGMWVRIDANGVTGWMDGTKLYFSQANWKRYVPILPANQILNPAFVETDNLSPPFITEAGFCGSGPGYSVRAQPFRDSERLLLIFFNEPLEVIGRARLNGAWSNYILIRHLESGIEGWILAECIGGFTHDDAVGWINPALPVYDFTRYIPAPENPVDSLPAKTSVNAYLRPYPYANIYPQSNVGISLDYLLSGTELTVTGRTDCNRYAYCWFEVRYADRVGWLWVGYLMIDGDLWRLPIVPQ